METAALLVALLVLGAVITEAMIRADERYRRHLRELERLEEEERK